MSVNKNLSKLALNVNTNGDVTDDGLAVAYTSNAYAQETFASNSFVKATFTSNNYSQGRFASNNFVKSNFTSNNYVEGELNTRLGIRATNTYVQSTFTSNTYAQDFFTNASNITSGTLASGRLSGTYSINISGSADRLDGKDSVDFASNTYIESKNFSSNSYIQGRFTSNNFAKSLFSSNNYVQTQLGLKLNSSSYTAADVLTKIKTVDGVGSGLDADLLDGKNSTLYTTNNYIQTFTQSTFVANNNVITVDTVNNRIGIGDSSPSTELEVSGTITDDVSAVRTPRHTSLSADTTITNEGVYILQTGVSIITLGASAVGTVMAVYNNVNGTVTLEDGSTVTSMRRGADNDTTHNNTLTLGARSMTTITWIDSNAVVVTGTDVT